MIYLFFIVARLKLQMNVIELVLQIFDYTFEFKNGGMKKWVN
jgi:hypothetical protein